MDYKEIISSCYCGDGGEKLKKAEALISSYGTDLLTKEETIQKQLSIVKGAVLALDTQMIAMELGKTCIACAAAPGGGCCSAYMGHENNDALLLMMNILAGVDVRLVRDDEIECCFLAETGCILLFKPIFCLNYLCSRIQKGSSEKQLRLLEQETGTVLTAQGQLELLIIGFLQSQNR
ncbi:hypothetical protein JYT85_02380 [Desulfocapsa sp. AH-315-G09]|uniref:Uncharacterized protein n=1 Tax=Desulfotalea psychrophila TaxID=84980 RepID=A0ABS3AUH4_9BACT|nr:hypothetical protein [Desulfocapsa sp.]MBN4059970.1 hypothetical protein [Desulfotalea psychrophila]MBN4065475.1 hypothetical protein [Desulfocapsa sp. AH-315-G09]MBN4068418.1 hypothetical protein [Desulfotalea psychrophila]